MPSSSELATAGADLDVNTTLAFITFLLYTAAGYGLLRRLIDGPDAAPGRRVSLWLGAAAATLHLLLLVIGGLVIHGVNLGFFGVSSLIAWLMAALLLLAVIRRPIENLGIVILPIAGLVTLLNAWFGRPVAVQELPAGLASHVISSVVAYSILALAAFQALLLAVQEYRLHHKHPGGFMRLLPPLQTMEHLLFQMVRLGFLGLSVSLLTGFLFLEDMFAQHLVHKTVLSLVAWVLFAALLIGRWRFGWRGKTAVRLTIGGFVVLMLSFFGSKFVLELILHYR